MWYMGLDKHNRPNGWSEAPSEGYIAVSESVRLAHEQHPDFVWDGATLSAPIIPEPPVQPPYVPTQITRRQCFIYLHRLGKLTTVKAMRQGMTEEEQISFDEASVVYRTDPIVEAVRQMMGWTPEQADQMFIDADKI